MKGTTNIPELEAIIEHNKQRRWTADIERTLIDYYPRFARDKDVRSLSKYINEKYGCHFKPCDLTKHYSSMDKGGSCET